MLCLDKDRKLKLYDSDKHIREAWRSRDYGAILKVLKNVASRMEICQ